MCTPVCLFVGVCIRLQVPVEADRGSWVPVVAVTRHLLSALGAQLDPEKEQHAFSTAELSLQPLCICFWEISFILVHMLPILRILYSVCRSEVLPVNVSLGLETSLYCSGGLAIVESLNFCFYFAST